MVKKLISKKGIFFTAMLVIMSATLLSLSVLLFNHSLESEKRFVELARLDRVHNLYSSIENGILNIFFYETNRDYSTFNNGEEYLEFNWTLTPQDISNILPTLDDFNSFIYSKYDDIVEIVITNNEGIITIDIDVNLVKMNVRKKWGIKVT